MEKEGVVNRFRHCYLILDSEGPDMARIWPGYGPDLARIWPGSGQEMAIISHVASNEKDRSWLCVDATAVRRAAHHGHILSVRSLN